MSLVDDILIILSSYSGGYKLMRKRIHGIADKESGKTFSKEESLRVTLSRLKSRGLIGNKNHTWHITKRGKEYLKNGSKLKLRHFSRFKSNKKFDKERMIVAFDIPEKKKSYRNWLRNELVSLDFEAIQKSVWLGPSPLPEEFVKYLDEIGILSYLKFFRVRKEDIVSG